MAFFPLRSLEIPAYTDYPLIHLSELYPEVQAQFNFWIQVAVSQALTDCRKVKGREESFFTICSPAGISETMSGSSPNRRNSGIT